MAYALFVPVRFLVVEKTKCRSFNIEGFDQIKQMRLMQTQNSRGSSAIAVSVGQRSNDDIPFGRFQGMTVG